jgi:hypothetical protein
MATVNAASMSLHLAEIARNVTLQIASIDTVDAEDMQKEWSKMSALTILIIRHA